MKMILVIFIMFWNVENFFDYVDGGTSASDKEFSSSGVRHWTKRRFGIKCSAVAKTIFYIADVNGGHLPDIIGFAEVENAFVLRSLLSSTNLKKAGYRIVHFEGPDSRGIDVALLYRSDVLTLKDARPCRVGDFPTRDILLARFVTEDGDSIAVSVNHHPSKYGGGESFLKRERAVGRLCELTDSLEMEGWRNQVAVGDFNDTPEQSLYDSLESRMVNMSEPLSEAGEGSIKFNGQWELIDQCFVSPGLAGKSRMQIISVPFLTVEDRGHSGSKPMRTYTGPRYTGGVSDHYPVSVVIDL